MKARIGCLLGLLAVPPAALAQLNETDTLRLHAKATASGTYLDGNVRRLILHNKVEVAYAQPAWGFSSRNDYHYGYTGPRKTEDDVLTWNFAYRHPFARVYPFAMFLGESNIRRGLPGLGLGWTALRGGVRYTYERIGLEGNRPDDRYATSGISLSSF